MNSDDSLLLLRCYLTLINRGCLMFCRWIWNSLYDCEMIFFYVFTCEVYLMYFFYLSLTISPYSNLVETGQIPQLVQENDNILTFVIQLFLNNCKQKSELFLYIFFYKSLYMYLSNSSSIWDNSFKHIQTITVLFLFVLNNKYLTWICI